MAEINNSQHPYSDDELVTAADLSRLLGVSRAAVSQVVHEESGRLDIFLDSKGQKRFHPVLSVAQWSDRRETRHINTPNRAQRAAGLTNEDAQALAHLPIAATRPVKAAAKVKAKPEDVSSPSKTSEREATPEPPRSPLSIAGPELEAERHELAQSRAEKERHAARLLELKVRREEGALVDRSVFFQRAYTLSIAIKDQLNGIPSQVGPSLVSTVEEGLISSGLTPEASRAILDRSNMQHVVHEALRLGITQALRELSAKPLEDLIG